MTLKSPGYHFFFKKNLSKWMGLDRRWWTDSHDPLKMAFHWWYECCKLAPPLEGRDRCTADYARKERFWDSFASRPPHPANSIPRSRCGGSAINVSGLISSGCVWLKAADKNSDNKNNNNDDDDTKCWHHYDPCTHAINTWAEISLGGKKIGLRARTYTHTGTHAHTHLLYESTAYKQ